MIRDSLLYFETPFVFFDFLEEHYIGMKWRIQEGLMNERGKRIENKDYTLYLRNLFCEKGFFRRLVSLAEIISWLDNLSLMYRLLSKLQKRLPNDDFRSLEISFEYMIEMSKRMRIDCILKKDTTILLLELRLVNSFNKVRPTWDKKFQELLVYKELLSYYVENYEVRLYALIPLYEYSRGSRNEKHYENNENQLNYLCDYIEKYLI